MYGFSVFVCLRTGACPKEKKQFESRHVLPGPYDCSRVRGVRRGCSTEGVENAWGPRVSFGLPVPTLTAPSVSIALLATTTTTTTSTTTTTTTTAATTATVAAVDDDAVGWRWLSIFPRSLRGRSIQTVDVYWIVLTSLLATLTPSDSHLPTCFSFSFSFYSFTSQSFFHQEKWTKFPQ